MLTMLMLTMTMAARANTVSSCATGDAPSGYSSQSCSVSGTDVCSYWEAYDSGWFFECDGDQLISGAPTKSVTMTVVYDYGGTGKFSAWGQTSGLLPTKFCCVLDDADDTLDYVLLYGTDNNDTLNFYDSASGKNLNAHVTTRTITAQSLGGAGTDTITGSGSTNSHYTEELWGGSGADTIHGRNGADFIQGGPGTDYLYGDDGNDLICDQDEGDYFEAGNGDDRIWYENTGSYTTPPMSGGSANPTTPSFGTDKCGDQANPYWEVTDYISNCGVVYINKPSGCLTWNL